MVEAAAFLALADVSLRLLRFRRTARLLGLRSRAGPADEPSGPGTPLEAAPEAAVRCGWAVRATAARMPAGGACLAQALACSAMVARRGMATTVHLGMARGHANGVEGLEAHAWTRCGAAVLTGAPHHDRYTPVAAFDAGPRTRPANRVAAGVDAR